MTAQLEGPRHSAVLETAAIFRVRNYRLFWIGSVFYYTGIWMDQVVRTALAFNITGSAFDLSVVVASQSLALGLLSAVGGTLADRVPKLDLMKRAQAVIVLDMAATFLLLATHRMALPALITMTAIFGGAIGISLPARLSFVSEIVDRAQFVRAYGFYYVAFNLLNVVGPALGGVALSHGGATFGFGFMTISQLVSFLLLLRIRPEQRLLVPREARFLTDVRSMFALIGNQRIALLMVMQAMSVSFVMSTTQLLPVFVARVYHSAVGSGVGALRASFGLGGLLGALAIAHAGRTTRKTRLLLVTGALQGLLLMAFAGAGNLRVGIAVLVVLGTFQAVYLTLTSTLFATSVGDAMRGRVMSLYLLATVAQPLIIIPLGTLSDHAGVQITILLCGFAFFALSSAIAFAFPGFRTIHEVSAAPVQRRVTAKATQTIAS